MFKISQIDHEIVKKIKMVEDFYDYYRLIDVEEYDVYDYINGHFIKHQKHCYEIFNRNAPCKNCISRLAVNNKQEYIKIERFKENTLLIVSQSIQIEGKLFSLELIKDVTKILFISDFDSMMNQKFDSFIKNYNSIADFESFTGLYNKNYVSQYINQCLSDNKKVILAIFDLNKLKNTNDCYTHLAGDKAILSFCKILKAKAEQYSGNAARFGGDEFAIFFTDKQLDEANQICHEIQTEFFQETIVLNEVSFKSSVSYGVEQSLPTDTFESLFYRADKKMYQDKENNRNNNL